MSGPPMPVLIPGSVPPAHGIVPHVPAIVPPLAPGVVAPQPPIPGVVPTVVSTMAPLATVPAPPGTTPTTTSMKPTHTIYVHNLNEKIKRDELKKSLFAIFAQFGKILDIVTAKNMKMKGQAFVVFQEQTSATQALAAMQGFPFYDKPMRIEYSRTESDIVTKAQGTFVERPKRQLLEGNLDGEGRANGEPHAKKKKKTKTEKSKSSRKSGKGRDDSDQPPNKILFVTHLPASVNQTLLESVFSQYSGFREVRMVPQRADIAFVEYNSEMEAAMVKQLLHGYCFEPERPMKVNFAKR